MCKIFYLSRSEISKRFCSGKDYARRLSENSNFLSDRGKLEKITGGI
jgi:hypothetical protein